MTEQVSKVCPVSGVSIGKRADKSTWRIDFAPEATDDQKKAAQAVIDGWSDAAEKQRAALEQILTLHTRVMALERERDRNPDSATTVQPMIDEAESQITALRGGGGK